MRQFARLKLSLLLATALSSSCAPVWLGGQAALPPRPAACDLNGPELEGTVTNHGSVDVPIEVAVKLRGYLAELKVCVVERDGHIEKLENRLKALGGN